ncbi:MarR family transcriptional regulator [Xanthobacter dioxanivorans]|uniref:MarR family transcriptional regulator n=1 Tax=Xanthobacter dioxanivorans TaxID=2528964 RepID=A0A974SIR1_9HYPH|nr:MarR family transcriptional regulator [Xanthobacter dioxanivorans]QRG07631.1 MarR family transcriptional regulator [Xanthobacter dioxanivorans]
MPASPADPPPPAFPRVDEFLCFAFYAASHAFTRVYKPLLDKLGLTYPQYLVMVALWDADDQTVGGIGEKLGLESSTLTPLLKRLEALGHVTRARDAADERVVRVRLTAQGGALREAALGIPGCILAATGLDLPRVMALQKEVTQLRAALERAAQPAQA